MAMSEIKQKLFQYELKKIGFPDAEYIPASGKIKIQPDNNRMPVINDGGEISFKNESRDFVFDILNPLVDSVNEAAAAWEKAQAVPFADLKKFRLLAEYNNVILAARDDTIYGRGLHYVTWEYTYNRTGVIYGHYTDDFNAAKEDFAGRSGLIAKEKIITREQAAEIVTVIENLMENDYALYLPSAKTDLLNEIIGNLRYAYPDKESWKKNEQEITSASTAKTIFGEVQAGDWVISAGNNDYRYLLGIVTAIDKFGSPEHETENETDDIHVDFTVFDYPRERIAEIEEYFSELYGEQKTFDEIPLDDIIMTPKMLIRITHLEQDEIEFMGNLRRNCETFCECFPGGNEPLSEKQNEFIERLNKNLDDYHKMLDGFGNRELISMADKISAMSDAHLYMTGNDFSNDELDFYLQFQNPLEVVADAWCDRNTDMEDMSYVLDEIYDKRNTLTDYPLMADKLPEYHETPEKPKQSIVKPKTLEEKLRAANEKAKAQQTKNNNTKFHKREELRF